MKYLKLPQVRVLAENIPLPKIKLEKIMAEGQSRVASFLDIHYPEEQEIIFLLGGKAVKAGRLTDQGREILTVTEALEKLRLQKQGTVGFYEISKLLMIVILGTFIFEPTHGRLKPKQINFSSLLALFARKCFTGYLELKLQDGLNYLTFFNGEPREGYFAEPVPPEESEFPVQRVARMVEAADDTDEINLYESVGEEGLHGDAQAYAPALEEPVCQEEDKAEFTADILDLCLAAIYEDVFRIMSNTCSRHLEPPQVEAIFTDGLNQVAEKFPKLFEGSRVREDGTPLAGGAINFERMLKAKKNLPANVRDRDFLNAMNELAALRLEAMRRALTKPVFEQGLKALNEKIAMSRKAYQGNFTIIKFLYEFSRLLEKVRPE